MTDCSGASKLRIGAEGQLTCAAGSAWMYCRALLLLMKERSCSVGEPSVLMISFNWSM